MTDDSDRIVHAHHDHTSVDEISWARLGGLLVELAERIGRDYRPEVVVGIAKGGVIPGVFLSSALLLDFYPIKLSSRHNEQVVHDAPVWHVYPTEHVAGKRVLLVDEMCVAGRTLGMASEELLRRGASEVRTATLGIHLHSVRPDYYALETDALIVWPWDRGTLGPDGLWSINKEYLDEMNTVPSYTPDPSPTACCR